MSTQAKKKILTPTTEILKPGVNEVTNQQYHGDKRYFSSSGLKEAYKNPIKFYQTYIVGKKQYERKDVFDEGTYLHSLILEPETVKDEFVFCKTNEEKKEANKERKRLALAGKPYKIALNPQQKAMIDSLYEAYLKDQRCVDLIKDGFAEYTVVSDNAGPMFPNLKVKIRTDYINIEKGYIADVKSTSKALSLTDWKRNTSEELLKGFMDLDYDLSAAMYIDVATREIYGLRSRKTFDFYFLVGSKATDFTEGTKNEFIPLKASKEFLESGQEKYQKALEKLEKARKSNWILEL